MTAYNSDNNYNWTDAPDDWARGVFQADPLGLGVDPQWRRRHQERQCAELAVRHAVIARQTIRRQPKQSKCRGCTLGAGSVQPNMMITEDQTTRGQDLIDRCEWPMIPHVRTKWPPPRRLQFNHSIISSRVIF